MSQPNNVSASRILRLFIVMIYILGISGITLIGAESKAFADINNTRADAWGTQEVASGGWMNHEGVPIYSNGATVGGPSPDTYNNVTNINNVSTQSGIEWQCVEMVNRTYLTEGWTTNTWGTDGYTLYGAAPSNLVDEAQNSITYLASGDVYTLNNGTGNPGHAGVIDSVTKSGSSYSVSAANQNTDQVYFTATFSSGTLSLPSGWVNSGYTVTGITHAPTRMMIIDGSSHAYSEDFLGNNWTTQVNNATITAIAVGGSGRMMILNSSGTVYSKDYPTASWVTQVSSGAKAIAVGGNGRMMIIDSVNNVYAKDGTSDSWSQETTLGGITAIAVGGNGRQMIIDNSNTAYSEDSIANSWTSQVSGAKAIAVGGMGRMMVINSGNNVYAKDNPSDSWTQETTAAGYTKIAVGGNGRQMMMDTSNTAYYEDSLANSWTSEMTSATAIGVGSNGRLVGIDSSGEAWGKDHPGDSWTALTSASGAAQIAINNE